MQDTTILISVTTILSGIIWALVFYFIRQTADKIKSFENRFEAHLERNCKLHSIEIANHQQAILQLEKKMWGEDKLAAVVQTAIENEFAKWENRLLKEGQLKINKEIK